MKEFLEEHQKIIELIVEAREKGMSEKLQKRIDKFLLRLETAINIYAEGADILDGQAKRFNRAADTLCEYRNLIKALIRQGEEAKLEEDIP